MYCFVPAALITIRFIAGLLFLWNSFASKRAEIYVALLLIAVTSDVFDGVIARKQGIATERLRIADSWTDAFFCACVAVAGWTAFHAELAPLAPALSVMIALQALSLGLDYWKYRRFSAYHAYSAKAAGLALFGAACMLFSSGTVSGLTWTAVGIAIVSHLERIAITLLLPRWTCDVASIWQAKKHVEGPG